jgi:hypothetical protein
MVAAHGAGSLPQDAVMWVLLTFRPVNVVAGFVDLAAQRAALFRRHPSLPASIVIFITGRVIVLVSVAATFWSVRVTGTATFIRWASARIIALVAIDRSPLNLERLRPLAHVPARGSGGGIRDADNEQECCTDLFETDIHKPHFRNTLNLSHLLILR